MSSRVTETRLCKYRMGRSCCKWCQFPCKPRLKSGHGKGFFFAKCTLKEIFGGKPYQRQESLEGRSIYEQECIPVDGYRPLQWPSLPWGGGRCLPLGLWGVCLWVRGRGWPDKHLWKHNLAPNFLCGRQLIDRIRFQGEFPLVHRYRFAFISWFSDPNIKMAMECL